MGESRYGLHLGATVADGVTRFAAYVTSAEHCAVRLFAPDLTVRSTHDMASRGAGIFEFCSADAGHGTLYKFVLDGRELPDPYARFLPHGVHGPAMVFEDDYAWRVEEWIKRPLSEHIIYELHVGTFTPEGTYAAASAHLAELRELGVTAIELMPVNAFPGERGWGYDGVAHFAPFAPYGSPDALRAFVDEAHSQGLSVLLDVVYNHFGPAGNYLAAYSSDYFATEVQNAWGQAPNFAHPAMRAWVLDNARYWLEDFRMDGLRLDAVHAMIDPSPKHVLREIVETARALAADKILIAEDDRNDPGLVSEVGLDALWADDFHHQARVTLTGERDGYYAGYEAGVAGLAQTIERGWLYEGQVHLTSGRARGKPALGLEASSFVYCIQNHDQIGNRALGDRINRQISPDAYGMLSSVLLFLPMTPLLFMGQEWAASSPFLYFTDHEPELGARVSQGRREEFKNFAAFSDPREREKILDPQHVDTFHRSKLSWREREIAPHNRVLGMYRALLKLRATDPVLRSATRAQLSVRAIGNVLTVHRWYGTEQRWLLANFGSEPIGFAQLQIPSEARLLFASASSTPATLLPAHAMIFAMPAAESATHD
jgi:maltooligosyltrehalose trehalohydrolase